MSLDRQEGGRAWEVSGKAVGPWGWNLVITWTDIGSGPYLGLPSAFAACPYHASVTYSFRFSLVCGDGGEERTGVGIGVWLTGRRLA
jgi:hypothetical protein